jgi:hypothetical protein
MYLIVRDRKMVLPAQGHFDVPPVDTTELELWGKYCPDRLGEEPDISLRRRGCLRARNLPRLLRRRHEG